ncbi:uncharacterized protein PHACADRAFT_254747 [Phanerochaete carnosa HHB-10118-sp]|nr:uncharacterized protein PHACADRAFT_254747 [Phanerochaete carnosa HHB-10118-sp]EKM57165.1 hypothetical protein PHACADRAFT_254747 [Phanerochaete carnosa HHB-10118-sp]
MSQCSLVSKFWAGRCRPRLFFRLTLRSLEDVNTLLSLPTAVKSYIFYLHLEEIQPSVPWTHHVYCAVHDGRLSERSSLSHKLNGACTPTSF